VQANVREGSPGEIHHGNAGSCMPYLTICRLVSIKCYINPVLSSLSHAHLTAFYLENQGYPVPLTFSLHLFGKRIFLDMWHMYSSSPFCHLTIGVGAVNERKKHQLQVWKINNWSYCFFIPHPTYWKGYPKGGHRCKTCCSDAMCWRVQLHEELAAADPRRHARHTPYVGISTSSSSSSGLASHQAAPHLALAAPAPHTVMLPDHHVVHPVVNPSIPEFTVRSPFTICGFGV